MALLFPFDQYWWLYLAFTAGVVGLLLLDLGILHGHAREMSVREAALWSVAWVALALGFNVALYAYTAGWLPTGLGRAALGDRDPEAVAWQVALEFMTGYLVEYSLSVDNIFVFVLVLGYFRVPARYQHRVLFYGILGALACRGLFIALGAVLMQIHWVVWLFGAFLIVTGLKMLRASETGPDPAHNPLIRLVRLALPVTPELHGQRFLVRQGGRLHATPLLVALLCLEASDIVFAIDSVPAIFALTREPFIVFSSNVFAILGLRSLYFLLGGAVERFPRLRYGLAVVLIFIGLKMVWLDRWYDGQFPIGLSLAVIGLALGASVIASLMVSRRAQALGEARTEEPSR